MPIEKSLAKNKYRFFQKRKVELKRDIGFAKKKSLEEEIQVLPRIRILFKNRYKFCQEKTF